MALALALSTSAGAVTITQSVNRNPELCKQFLAMVKAAGVPHMTDAQLCSFSFAKLPASETKGFAFPKWTTLPVANAESMYRKMALANRAAYPKYPDLPKGSSVVFAQIGAEAKRHNVTFYTATLPTSLWSSASYLTATQRKAMPPSLTFVKMWIPGCSKTSLVEGRSYAFFTKQDLSSSIPQLSFYDYSEFALWNGSHHRYWTVALYVSPLWLVNQGRPGIDVTVNSVAWQPKSWFSVAGLAGSTACSYSITKDNVGAK